MGPLPNAPPVLTMNPAFLLQNPMKIPRVSVDCKKVGKDQYQQGYVNPDIWTVLISQLVQGDFLHDFLVPLTANAVRIPPPEIPPEAERGLATEKPPSENPSVLISK